MELRGLSTHCKFGDYLDEALRDHLVCGLRSEATQKQLLAEVGLTLAKAMVMAQGQEAAERNVKALKGTKGEIKQLNRTLHCSSV